MVNELKLMHITNDSNMIRIAEECGVERIFIDLERIGKHERQGHLNTFISEHSIEDVARASQIITRAKLLVRINPIHHGTKEEIDRVIYDRADVIMLPMFKNKKDVETFVDIVGGRVRTCLLFETKEALENVHEIVEVNGVDEIHVGLNDLHLALGSKFMFQLLSNGTVDYLANIFHSKNIQFGFGGIAAVGYGDLPAEMIIREHVRLKSKMVILSRAFQNSILSTYPDSIEYNFRLEIAKIKEIEKLAKQRSDLRIEEDRLSVITTVNRIVRKKLELSVSNVQ